MTKITARRILLLFGVLAAIFIAFGLAMPVETPSNGPTARQVASSRLRWTG